MKKILFLLSLCYFILFINSPCLAEEEYSQLTVV